MDRFKRLRHDVIVQCAVHCASFENKRNLKNNNKFKTYSNFLELTKIW